MFASATFLISFGALLGKTTLAQLVIIGFIETMIYAVNLYLVITKLEAVDMGGSMVIHTFGALFGLAVSFSMLPKRAGQNSDNRSRYISDQMAFIGTAFLWLYWPSFNAAFAGDRQYRVVLNTVLALTGSTIATFIFSHVLRPHHKLEMIDVCNATLAGGVAVGSSSDLVIGPGSAIVIGFCAGFLSVCVYVYLQPYLEQKIGLSDTCGVQALHAAPGILGAISGAFACESASRDHSLYGDSFDSVFPHGDKQASYQIAALAVTIGMSLVGGYATGLFTKFVTKGRFLSEEQRFHDDNEWVVASGEYDTIPEQEDMHRMYTERQRILAEDKMKEL
jgi:ammonium transporter Rh